MNNKKTKKPKKPKAIWKDIGGVPGYQVSDDGRVRSKFRAIVNNGRRQIRQAQYIRAAEEDGYKYVNLSIKGKTKKYYVHQLVARAFLGEMPPDKSEIDHINRVRNDNRPQNLRYVNKKEQSENRVLNPLKGSKTHRAQFDEDEIREIRARGAKGEGAASIHKDYSDRVGLDAICKILNRRTWKHVK